MEIFWECYRTKLGLFIDDKTILIGLFWESLGTMTGLTETEMGMVNFSQSLNKSLLLFPGFRKIFLIVWYPDLENCAPKINIRGLKLASERQAKSNKYDLFSIL